MPLPCLHLPPIEVELGHLKKTPCNKCKMGRRKVDTMQLIPMQSQRQVTFSKRTAALMKKAFELSVLCQVQIGVIAYSLTNKPYAFGHPDIDYVVRRYLNRSDIDCTSLTQRMEDAVRDDGPKLKSLYEELKEATAKHKALKEDQASLAKASPPEKKADIDDMSLEELQYELQKTRGEGVKIALRCAELDWEIEELNSKLRRSQQGVYERQPFNVAHHVTSESDNDDDNEVDSEDDCGGEFEKELEELLESDNSDEELGEEPEELLEC